MIRNHHSRTLHSTMAKAEPLLARLGTDQDALWPRERWPAMRFKEGLRPGAQGGHGPIRYTVEHVDARNVRFRFTGPEGFHGWHGLDVGFTHVDPSGRPVDYDQPCSHRVDGSWHPVSPSCGTDLELE